MIYILVGVAGALGSVLRYLIGIFLFTSSTFPWATLIINLSGSFLLAWLTTILFRKVSVSPTVANAVGSGFVGSFTTFSALSVETIELFKTGDIFSGVIYVTISIIGGFVMSWLGFKANKEVEKA